MESDSKLLLKERLHNLNISGRTCYLLYGNPEPERLLIRAADKFTNKPISSDTPFGEKRILTGYAKHIAVRPVMDHEFLVVDKQALEVLEELYSVS